MIGPKMDALLKKMGQDDLGDFSDAQSGFVAALIEQIELMSPAGAQAVEALVLGAIQPAAQAALAAAVAQVKL